MIFVTRVSWGAGNSKRSDALRTDLLFNLLSPRGNVRYEWTCGQRMESPFNLAILLGGLTPSLRENRAAGLYVHYARIRK
jgi:hypothetical protein